MNFLKSNIYRNRVGGKSEHALCYGDILFFALKGGAMFLFPFVVLIFGETNTLGWDFF